VVIPIGLYKSQFTGAATALNVVAGRQRGVNAMKALILYVLFVVIGALISTGIGYYVEIEFSSTASLIVFLALFFANFAVSWLAVILVMDGSLKDAQGRQAQLDIEKSGRAGIALRNQTRSQLAQQSSHSERSHFCHVCEVHRLDRIVGMRGRHNNWPTPGGLTSSSARSRACPAIAHQKFKPRPTRTVLLVG
jgi:hypothetical protein